MGTTRTGLTPELESMRADDLWRRLDDLVCRAGFSHWSYAAAPGCPTATAEAPRVTTYPAAHVKSCVDHGLLAPCPGLSFAFGAARPALFRTVRARTPMTRRLGALLRLNREFGVTRGIVVPLRDVFGFTGMLAVSFDGSDAGLENLWKDRHEALLAEVSVCHREALSRFPRHFTRNAVPSLTARQREILHLLAQGLSTQDIADSLHISVDTINKHSSAIKRHLGARTVGQATALAVRWGLI
jgi:DNA-binding CsgD family transcriptional regulator